MRLAPDGFGHLDAGSEEDPPPQVRRAGRADDEHRDGGLRQLAELFVAALGIGDPGLAGELSAATASSM